MKADRSRLLAAAALAACGDVPESPTYLDDVRPILLASCARCHAAPTACTAPDRRGFRLDHWRDVDGARGVASMTERITVRATDGGTMPPDRPLTDRARELLGRWQRAGSPLGERDDDHPPTFAARSALPTDEPTDQRARLVYDVDDADGDATTWALGWRRDDAAGIEGLLVESIEDGHGELDVDLGVLPAGPYRLFARLRSETGAAPIDVTIGEPLTIPIRDATPAVRLLHPVGGERLSRSDDLEIRWHADDADSPGPLTADIVLVTEGGEARAVATDVDARRGVFTWQPGDTAAGSYLIEVTISDDTSERRARSSCPFELVGS